jgi:hypothetical protein
MPTLPHQQAKRDRDRAARRAARAKNFVAPLTRAGIACKACDRYAQLCRYHRDLQPGSIRSHHAVEIPTDRCGAKNRNNGKPCQARAGLGTDHFGIGRCSKHGGNSPAGKRSAHRARAIQYVRTYGLQRTIAPHEALLEEVHRTAGIVQWLEERIREMEPDALVWGLSRQSKTEGLSEAGEMTDVTRMEHIASVNIWLELYQRERKHLIDVCKTAIGCGIAERQVRLAEEHGKIIANVIAGILGQLGIDRGTEEVRAAIRSQLTLVAANETIIDAEEVQS